jgi:hypothetical protein
MGGLPSWIEDFTLAVKLQLEVKTGLFYYNKNL